MVKIPRTIFTRPIDQELGFGKHLTTTGRMMNPDGTFNVERQPLSRWDNTYFQLVTMSWRRFISLVFVCHVLLNLVFSVIYLSIGLDQLDGVQPGSFYQNFLSAFFFSTQTLSTVGYGHISPVGWGANAVAALESFAGVLVFALISGLLYGRFSRSSAKIVFSSNLLVAPYRDGKGLMLRMGNARKSELIETEVQIYVAMNQPEENGSLTRRFFDIPLKFPESPFSPCPGRWYTPSMTKARCGDYPNRNYKIPTRNSWSW
ncbi:MAG: ion transporter [Lewinellaceae bacterium]|nr:ion transporter [Lewinellaceae bacterium]